jgi:uncharacterized protein (TIGR00296 family)
MSSALRDPRFPPIQLSEVPRLKLGISILQDFTDISKTPFNWEIGVHGIQLEIRHKTHQPNKTYSATFLPEVPLEQGWDKVDTVVHLLYKSGYPLVRETRVEEWEDLDPSLERNEVIKVKTYKSIKREFLIDFGGE